MNDPYDLVIIGAGEAGQAAAHLARKLGGSVATIDRQLFGGSCPYCRRNKGEHDERQAGA